MPTTTTKMTADERKRAQALTRLTRVADARRKTQAAEKKAYRKLGEAVLAAKDTDGLSYKDIAKVLGVSTVRVSQMLFDVRSAQEPTEGEGQ